MEADKGLLPDQTSEERHPNHGFIARAQKIFVYIGGLYAAVLLLLFLPSAQTHLVYMHAIKWPFNAKFDLPHKYGLAPYKTVNMNLTTSDNFTIGAWFVLADDIHQSCPLSTRSAPTAELTRNAVQTHPTVVFFHGNAATRAVSYRVSLYSSITSRLGANVLAIDYRGFGDSDGTPSEQGLGRDARAAWDWLLRQGAKPDDIVIMGQSLGTGVATLLGAELALEDTKPRGVVLVAAFSSIETLLETFQLAGFLPLLRPLLIFPYAFKLIMYFLTIQFDTASRLPTIKAPILLIHAINDPTIPDTHTDALFTATLEPYLPPFPFTKQQLLRPHDHWGGMNAARKARDAARAELVTEWQVQDYATMSEFSRGVEKDGWGNVKMVKTLWGGHTPIVRTEGVVDLIGDFLDIKRA